MMVVLARLWLVLTGAFLALRVVQCFAEENASGHESSYCPLDALFGECLEYRSRNEWWSYKWCYKDHVDQNHFHANSAVPSITNSIGSFQNQTRIDEESWKQTFEHESSNCGTQEGSELLRRVATVNIKCCLVDHSDKKRRRSRGDIKLGTFIERVEETSLCTYHISVCSELACSDTSKDRVRQQLERDNAHDEPKEEEDKVSKTLRDVSEVKREIQEKAAKYSFSADSALPVSIEEQRELKEKAKEMFYHGYNSYLDNAFPQADLKPVSCTGGKFDLIKIPLVTLIDALDTLVILNNFTEFRRAVSLIDSKISSFDFDVNVSVFETTIRVLGGLLSAHMMAVDPELNIYDGENYNGCLLDLATDMGDRLLPAFETTTGIPYGTVNLRKGVPKGETELASTAGAGSLVIELEVLSCLTGDESYGLAARSAIEAIYDRRSDINLVGKHIHVRSGKWYETLSGVGSNSDSFYEYLLKAYLLFRRQDYYFMFNEVFRAVKEHSLQEEQWFRDVDMYSGKTRSRRSESLQAFWPGMEALLGMTHSSSNLLNAFYLVLKDFEFLPEEFDYVKWSVDKKRGSSVYYPLRPELIESTYMHFMTTRDRSWLIAGRSFLQAIETHSRTECGYAAVKDITSMDLEDDMPSYFLSETCKYLYLLFDESNMVHRRNYIFSTEAHPFDTLQLATACSSSSHIPHYESGYLTLHQSDSEEDVYTLFSEMMNSFESIDEESVEYTEPVPAGSTIANHAVVNLTDPAYVSWKEGRSLHDSLLKCPITDWWQVQPYALPNSNSAVSSNIPSSTSQGEGTNEQQQEVSTGNTLLDMIKALSMKLQSGGLISGVDESSEFQGNNGDDDPLGICYFRDDPNRAINQQKVASSDGAVELNAGELGIFVVNIFSDGFVIKSHQFNNVMEISGIGQPSMFVKEYNDTHSSAVVAMHSKEVATCNVYIEADHSPDSSDIWKEEDFDSRYRPDEFRKKRTCSMAAFGPTLHRANFPSHVVSGPMKRLSSEESCQSSRDSNVPDNEGHIVVADRGSCMFEEKAINAEKLGGSAAVIVNSEPSIFMMAGLVHLSGDGPASSLSSLKSHIPTVMLSSTDGNYITNAVEYLASKGMSSRVHVDVVGIPALFDSLLMGYSGHPRIRVSEKVIQILGLGKWSVYLSLTQELQWQLYIVPTVEMNLATPWNAQTTDGLPYCTNSDFSFEAAKSYMQLVKEECPSFVSMKDDELIEIRKQRQ